jgi:hypothetical protein
MDVHLTSSGDNISRAGVSELEDLRGACLSIPNTCYIRSGTWSLTDPLKEPF